MIALTSATRVFIAVTAVDLRGSFNRLSALVEHKLLEDPLSGHLFVFTNKPRNRLKVLFWDGTGLWVCAKRLERGRFSWPSGSTPSVTWCGQEFAALLSGLEVTEKKGWYRH